MAQPGGGELPLQADVPLTFEERLLLMRSLSDAMGKLAEAIDEMHEEEDED